MATNGSTPHSAFSAGDFSKMSEELYQTWERGMRSWWDQVLESPAFLDGMGKQASSMATARKQYEEAVDDNLRKMHLPTRADLARVARIATLLEEKLLQVEDVLLEMKDENTTRMAALEREAIQARIEAAEARLELRERLAAMEARIDALGGAPAREAGRPSKQKPAATGKGSSTSAKG